MSKKGSGSILGSVMLLLAIGLVFWFVKGCNVIVQSTSEGTVEEQREIVLHFVQEIDSIEKSVDYLKKDLPAEFSKFDPSTLPNLDLIVRAEDEYMSASLKMKSIKIPSGLPEERKNKLENIRTELEYAYSFKSFSLMHFRRYFIEQEEKEIQDCIQTNALSQNSLIKAASEIVVLKNELGLIDGNVEKTP